MSINFSGMIQGRRSRRWGRITRQTDGRNAAVWRVVLGDMQIIKIQTIRCTKAKSDRRGDAVTLIFDFVASGIVRFFAHYIQAHRGGITNDLIDVQRAAAEPGAANTGGGVNAGIIARLLADHIDRACRCAAPVVGAGRPFNHFDLLGIEGVARDAADIANAININTVRGIGTTHINGVASGGVTVLTRKKRTHAGDVFERVGKVGCALIFNHLFRNYRHRAGSIRYRTREFRIGRLLWRIKRRR